MEHEYIYCLSDIAYLTIELRGKIASPGVVISLNPFSAYFNLWTFKYSARVPSSWKKEAKFPCCSL